MASLEEIKNNNYFITTWSQDLLCKPEVVQDIYGIKDRGSFLDDVENTLVLTSDGYEEQHHELANSLQLYYTLLPKKSKDENGSEEAEGEVAVSEEATGEVAVSEEAVGELDHMNKLLEMTPVLVQRTDSILTTLLFITLDQNHDFRGGRTVGTDSWVVLKNPALIKRMKLEPGQSIEEPFDNSYLSTLVNTTFSGHNSIIGLLVLNEEDMNLLLTSESASMYFDETDNLNFQKIMTELFTRFSFENYGGDIVMKGTNANGDIEKIDIGDGKTIHMTFLSFAQSTWDHGMHDIWHFDRPKHIFLVKLDKLTNNNGKLEPSYSGHKYTTVQNIIPQYEILYSSNSHSTPSYIKCIENMEYSFDQQELTDELLDRFYNILMGQFYPNHDSELCKEASIEALTGGLKRGASYKLYGLASSEEKVKSLFYELCKRIGRKINNSIDAFYSVPQSIQSGNESCPNYEDLREKIQQLKANPKIINSADHIYKQCGTVNDMNLTNLDSFLTIKMLNGTIDEKETLGGGSEYEYNEDYVLDDSVLDDEKRTGGSGDDETPASTSSAPTPALDSSASAATTLETMSTSSTPRIKTSTSAFVLSKDNCGTKLSTKDCGEYIQTVLESKNPDCIEEQYPTKFQVNSGVVDSSGLGGQNMAKYFAPDIDIFMTIFDNKTTELMGAVLRLTFVKSVETNIIDTKNNAKVYCHFIYIDFNEAELVCDELTSNNEWKKDYSMYPLALKQLLSFAVENTYFDSSSILERNTIPYNLILKLNNGETKKWFYYFTSSEGPSVKQINTTVTNIVKKFLDWVLDGDDNPVDIIVRVAQRVYAESQSLQAIMPPNKSDELDIHGNPIERNTHFEAIFLLRIKYVGDKGRSTDPLFLNNNQYVEALQVTGDGNAYFTGVMFGTSTLFSTPTGTNLYFAPYMTPSGKCIKNEQIDNEIKKEIFKGVSPAESQKSAEKKMVRKELPMDELVSNLFNSIINPSKNICTNISIKDFNFGSSRFANPLTSMNILNGDDAIEMATLINKITMINTANQVVDNYMKIAEDFEKELNEIAFIPEDIRMDFSKKMSSKCIEPYPIPGPEELTKLADFVSSYRLLEKVFGNLDDSFENIVKSFLNPDKKVENRNNFPVFEDSLYNCFKSGLENLKNECRKLGESYSSGFEKVQINQKYSELTVAFDSLIDEEKQEAFIAGASKIKLDIINLILDGLIENMVEVKDEKATPQIVESLNFYIEEIKKELINTRNNSSLPSSVKEKVIGLFFRTEVEKLYNSLKGKGSNNDKVFFLNVWPLNMSYIDSIKYPEPKQITIKPCDPYLFGYQLLATLRDYNNNFANIIAAISNHKTYKLELEELQDKLKKSDIPNQICEGVPLYVCVTERIYRIYKNIVTYKKCIDNQINPPPEKPVKPSKTPSSSRRVKISPVSLESMKEEPGLKPTVSETTAATTIESATTAVSEEPPKELKPDIEIKPSVTGRVGKVRVKVSRQLDEPDEGQLGGEEFLTAERKVHEVEIDPPTTHFKPDKQAEPDEPDEMEDASPTSDKMVEKAVDIASSPHETIYKSNKIRIVKRLLDIMKFYNSSFSNLVNSEGILNYSEIMNVQQLLTAIMLLNMKNNLGDFSVETIDKLIEKISTSLQKAITLDEVLDVRYIYDSFFERALMIDSIQPNPIEFVLSNYDVTDIPSEVEEGASNILKLKPILRKYYYLLAFIYEYNYPCFDEIALSNYFIISKLFSELDSLNLNYSDIANKDFNDFVNDYIFIYIFCIKYANQLLQYVTTNSLVFGKENGFLDDFSEVETMLKKENVPSEFFMSLKEPMEITKKPSLESLDDMLSLPGEKTTYFNTSNSFENAYRVFCQVFLINPIHIPEDDEEISIKEVVDGRGGKNKTSRNIIPRYHRTLLKTRVNYKKTDKKRITRKNKRVRNRAKKYTKRSS